MERVHPGVAFDGAEGPKLTAAIRHQFGDSVSDVIARLDRYSDLKAQDLREHGGKTGVADNARRGAQRFLKCYFKRGGWRDGSWGLLISLMAATDRNGVYCVWFVPRNGICLKSSRFMLPILLSEYCTASM